VPSPLGSFNDPETIYRNRGEKGVGEYNRGNFRDDELDALAAASSKQAYPEKRKALIRQVFKRHHQQVHHIPLHRQFIPWAARSNVNLVHRADNWLELRWVKVGP
jgi:peptide/nickel transport system substrate-binding protein